MRSDRTHAASRDGSPLEDPVVSSEGNHISSMLRRAIITCRWSVVTERLKSKKKSIQNEWPFYHGKVNSGTELTTSLEGPNKRALATTDTAEGSMRYFRCMVVSA